MTRNTKFAYSNAYKKKKKLNFIPKCEGSNNIK